VPRLATIGVYGFTAETFIRALREADAQLVADVRQRRGVRGSEYAWANSVRLQAALVAERISYRHLPELAPTTELRRLQYREDARLGVGKRSRAELASVYRERYLSEILDGVDLAGIVDALPAAGSSVLLCVERDAAACHRSIIAQRIADRYGLSATHILPATP
jgi:uncharacterized protein (DUF488 family)